MTIKHRQAKIISMVNQKGGVGKTTSCINLPAAMAHLNRELKFLIIDLDPQGNASTGFGIKRSERQHNIYDVLTNRVDIRDAVRATVLKNLDIKCRF